jgi:hypothetical protein
MHEIKPAYNNQPWFLKIVDVVSLLVVIHNSQVIYVVEVQHWTSKWWTYGVVAIQRWSLTNLFEIVIQVANRVVHQQLRARLSRPTTTSLAAPTLEEG